MKLNRKITTALTAAILVASGGAVVSCSSGGGGQASTNVSQPADPYAQSVEANRGHVDKLCDLVKDEKHVTVQLHDELWKLYTTLPSPDEYALNGVFQHVEFIHDNFETVKYQHEADGSHESLADYQSVNDGELATIKQFCADPYREE